MKSISNYVKEFMLDDMSDNLSKKSFKKEAIEILNVNLQQEFNISFSDLEQSLKDDFIENIKEEYACYKE